MNSVTKSAGARTGNPRSADGNRLLIELGDRVRALRERREITRKALSLATGVSQRHLANLEYGEGNVSVLVLEQVAAALHCSLAELIGDFTTRSPEWLLLRSLLKNQNEDTLRRIRIAAGEMLDSGENEYSESSRIALIGLRGAGKSTLGAMLAQHLDCKFIELSRSIEKLAGCTIGEIQDLYGTDAFRRYQHRALVEVIEHDPTAVIAVPGGLVSDASTFDLLLSSCHTVWLQAKPEDHMQRVVEQGDLRPMAGSSEAMEDLKDILASRSPFYARAQHQLDTSELPLQRTFKQLCGLAGRIGQNTSIDSVLNQQPIEEIRS
ncbi:MAG: helix-turn-helix transcriptional regulator [Gammaproteobacteria bacterium]|nr:helix-turn-helix transcriptional regulator [Gammaproteobacteria bacterium]MDH3858144.1 helix-turn-helix transcriptional regulator [Gammaproteobacteria bacterium]